MRDAVIDEAARTPVSKHNGGLSGVHPTDVIWSCVSQIGEQTFDTARNAVLAAGHYDVVVAGGVESLSARR